MQVSHTSSITERCFGEVEVNIGDLSTEVFYEIVKFLGNETDLGCDWRRIVTHMGESNLTVDVIRQRCHDSSYASAKFVLEHYLETEFGRNDSFDPVQVLEQLFEDLELHEPLMYLRRVIDEHGNSASEDENSD